MDLQEVVRQLIREDRESLRQMTRDCRPCRRFVRQIRRERSFSQVDWGNFPETLLSRFSRQLHERLFQY